MSNLINVLVKPLITEKSSALSEEYNKYGFYVAKSASKTQIKLAVEHFYDVKVLSVNTTTSAGYTKRAGKSVKKVSAYKKAYIKLKDGQKIEFFKGV